MMNAQTQQSHRDADTDRFVPIRDPASPTSFLDRPHWPIAVRNGIAYTVAIADSGIINEYPDAE